MSRLTNKTELGDYIFIDGEMVCPNEIATKLGKLEDLQDELGCPLEVVFKALKEGYQYKLVTTNIITKEAIEQIIKTDYAYLSYSDDCWWIATIRDCHRLSDYKNTWWLKEI